MHKPPPDHLLACAIEVVSEIEGVKICYSDGWDLKQEETPEIAADHIFPKMDSPQHGSKLLGMP